MEFDAANDAGFFAAIPPAATVFLLRGDDSQAEPYVSKTANLRRRLQRLLGPPTELSKKLNLRDRVRVVEFTATGSDFESGFLLYQLLRVCFPKTYGSRLRLRFAPVVKLHMENEYPRASITTRIGRLEGKALYYGPFPGRALAEKFTNDSLDAFKMRRCVDDLHPDPQFPGCIYSEMKMCLAPCFKGCTDAEYASEVGRVQAYFDSGGDSLVREISVQREQASANLEFEKAAEVHARLDKLKPVLAQLPEIVRRIDQLRALIVQPCAMPGCVALFRVDAGCLSGPAAFSIQPAEHAKSQSMESRVQEAVGAINPVVAPSSVERMEHLAILKRWFYRGTRIGEIFLADHNGELPFRRIVRGISRVFRGEKTETVSPNPGA
ncbi:MAG TPA: UvrB/UvrC motif-containing protein [Terriglobales bacterium]